MIVDHDALVCYLADDQEQRVRARISDQGIARLYQDPNTWIYPPYGSFLIRHSCPDDPRWIDLAKIQAQKISLLPLDLKGICKGLRLIHSLQVACRLARDQNRFRYPYDSDLILRDHYLDQYAIQRLSRQCALILHVKPWLKIKTL